MVVLTLLGPNGIEVMHNCALNKFKGLILHTEYTVYFTITTTAKPTIEMLYNRLAFGLYRMVPNRDD